RVSARLQSDRRGQQAKVLHQRLVANDRATPRLELVNLVSAVVSPPPLRGKCIALSHGGRRGHKFDRGLIYSPPSLCSQKSSACHAIWTPSSEVMLEIESHRALFTFPIHPARNDAKALAEGDSLIVGEVLRGPNHCAIFHCLGAQR